MGGDQAAAVLATVHRDQLEGRGEEWSSIDEEDFKTPIRERYEAQGSAYYSTARLWDDGIIDPSTRARCSPSPSAPVRMHRWPIRPTASFGCRERRVRYRVGRQSG